MALKVPGVSLLRFTPIVKKIHPWKWHLFHLGFVRTSYGLFAFWWSLNNPDKVEMKEVKMPKTLSLYLIWQEGSLPKLVVGDIKAKKADSLTPTPPPAAPSWFFCFNQSVIRPRVRISIKIKKASKSISSFFQKLGPRSEGTVDANDDDNNDDGDSNNANEDDDNVDEDNVKLWSNFKTFPEKWFQITIQKKRAKKTDLSKRNFDVERDFRAKTNFEAIFFSSRRIQLSLFPFFGICDDPSLKSFQNKAVLQLDISYQLSQPQCIGFSWWSVKSRLTLVDEFLAFLQTCDRLTQWLRITDIGSLKSPKGRLAKAQRLKKSGISPLLFCQSLFDQTKGAKCITLSCLRLSFHFKISLISVWNKHARMG